MSSSTLGWTRCVVQRAIEKVRTLWCIGWNSQEDSLQDYPCRSISRSNGWWTSRCWPQLPTYGCRVAAMGLGELELPQPLALNDQVKGGVMACNQSVLSGAYHSGLRMRDDCRSPIGHINWKNWKPWQLSVPSVWIWLPSQLILQIRPLRPVPTKQLSALSARTAWQFHSGKRRWW